MAGLGSKRGGQLVSLSHQGRVQDPLHGETATFNKATTPSGSVLERIETKGTPESSRPDVGERSDRTSFGTRIPRVLQSSVFSAQEFGWMETGPGCQRIERFCGEDQVYHGDVSVCAGSSPSRGLDGIPGPAGRLLSYSHPPDFKEVFKVCDPGQMLPVQSSLFRPQHSSSSVHQSNVKCGRMASSRRDKSIPVPRRLADKVPVEEQVSGGLTQDVYDCSGSGSHYQQREVSDRTESDDSLFGDSSGLSSFSGFSLTRKANQVPRESSVFPGEAEVLGKGVDEFVGHPLLAREICLSGKVAPQTSATLPFKNLGQEESGGLIFLPHSSRDQETSELVAGSVDLRGRNLPTQKEPRPSVVLRCFGVGMGSNTGEQGSFRLLGRGTNRMAHQQERVDGHLVRFKSLQGICRGENNRSEFRQHHGSCVYQQTRRDSFFTSLRNSKRAPSVDKRPQGGAFDEIRAGAEECKSRHAQQKRASSAHGMDSQSSSLPETVEFMGEAFNRPLRLQPEQENPELLLSSPGQRSNSSRRLLDGLDGDGHLCVPSVQDNQSSSQEIRPPRFRENDPGSPLLASKRVVHRGGGDVSGLSEKSSPKSKASQTAPL